jgi:CheY-like chemotaxis protein
MITTEFEKQRVLIVDDEPVVVRLLAEGLSKSNSNYIVETAATAQEALQKITQLEYMLVLTDYRMPGMNGLELVKVIRDKSPETQIVMMTAYESQQLMDAKASVQLDGFLSKPVSINKVREFARQAVEVAISRKEAVSEIAPEPSIEIKQELEDLKVRTNARCVLLLNSNGSLIEMAGLRDGLDITGISALAAANFMAATELARLLGNESVFKSCHHEGPNYDIHTQDCNGECFLATIFGSESKTGIVRFYSTATTESLRPLLEKINSQENNQKMDISAEVESQLDELFGRNPGWEPTGTWQE